MEQQDSKDGVYFSLIIPTCSKPEEMQLCIEGACTVLDTCVPQKYEIIVVEQIDVDVAKTLETEYAQLRIITEAENEPSISRGWNAAHGEILGVIDGNPLQEPTTLVQLLEEIKKGADFVISSQYGSSKIGAEKPLVGCFAIRRDSISTERFAKSGYKVLLDAIGPENLKGIQALTKNKSGASKRKSYFGHIQHLFHTKLT